MWKREEKELVFSKVEKIYLIHYTTLRKFI